MPSPAPRADEDRTIRHVSGNREIKIDVNIITATNRDLETEVADGRFRGDLYHRLSVFQIVLPSLVHRVEDIEELVNTFVSEFAERRAQRIDRIPQEVWNQLKDHSWPGNVRELRNVTERCVLLSRVDALETKWLQLSDVGSATPTTNGDSICFPMNGSVKLDDIEQRMIEEALRRLLRKARLRKSLKNLFTLMSAIAVWTFGLMLAALVAFPNLTPTKLLAALGIGSVAIGFAFKDIFENFLAGIIILLRREMRIGDFIECEGIEGKVEDILVRETHSHLVDRIVAVGCAQITRRRGGHCQESPR